MIISSNKMRWLQCAYKLSLFVPLSCHGCHLIASPPANGIFIAAHAGIHVMCAPNSEALYMRYPGRSLLQTAIRLSLSPLIHNTANCSLGHRPSLANFDTLSPDGGLYLGTLVPTAGFPQHVPRYDCSLWSNTPSITTPDCLRLGLIGAFSTIMTPVKRIYVGSAR